MPKSKPVTRFEGTNHKSDHRRRRRFLYSRGHQRPSAVEGVDNLHQRQLLYALLVRGQLLIFAVHFVIQGGELVG